MSSPYLSSPDQQSSVFPDRLIRPLPKRTLRSRLSEEAAEAIPFPPNPPSSSFPAFNQYGENGEYMNDAKVLVQQDDSYCDHTHDAEHSHPHHHHCNRHHQEKHSHNQQGINDDEDSLEDEDRKPPPMRTRTNGYRQAPHSPRNTRSSRHSNSKAGYSGADGYDAFENTNNKKKRKIPTSGNTGLHHASLSAELAQLGLNSAGNALDSALNGDNPDNQYAAAAANGTTSRKDVGRRGSGRNPLGVSTGNSNVTGPPRASPTDDLNAPDKGIISAAIANATALLRKPLQKGQDGGETRDQQARDSSPNTEFTFTCETEAAKGVSFPEQSLYAAGYHQRLANSHTSGPPANPSATSHAGHPLSAGQAANGQYAQQPTPSQAAAPERKPRRRGRDIYSLAARDRRVQQAYANRHHPPSLDEIWICQFCEYESIFGVPPSALIRQYEIKDRRERKRLEEKRRLLEKAKMKGRKGKKQSKNAAKAANGVNQQPANQQPYDQQSIDQQPLEQFAGDEYLEVDDGFDDNSVPLPAPPLAPLKPSMPGSYDETRWEGTPGNAPSKGQTPGRV